MAEIYFNTKDLAVGYNGKALIHDINISIEKGEIVTLIGPNGSGKSTILKSITRQLKIIGGGVWVASEELEKIHQRELARKMAVVLTERMKPELMTCRDVVSTGRYPYTGRLGLLSEEDEAIVTNAMERVHALELAVQRFIVGDPLLPGHLLPCAEPTGFGFHQYAFQIENSDQHKQNGLSNLIQSVYHKTVCRYKGVRQRRKRQGGRSLS